MEELFAGRKGFAREQWIDALLRSTGMEPTCFKERVKWHLLARMIAPVKNTYKLCELGPRGKICRSDSSRCLSRALVG